MAGQIPQQLRGQLENDSAAVQAVRAAAAAGRAVQVALFIEASGLLPSGPRAKL